MESEESEAITSTPRRDWALLLASTFLFMFGFSVYSGVFQNYLRDDLRAGPLGLGILESIREVPGLLAALTIGIFVSLAESRVAALGLLVTAIGVGATGAFREYWPLVGITVFWSVGFHLYSSVSSAITLTLAKGVDGGRHLGRVTSMGAAGTIAGLGAGWLAAKLFAKLPYDGFFLVAGLCILASALFVGSLSAHAAGAPRARLILRREYALYYLLIFLEGCRRQIFSIFASFALILHYNVPRENMLLLHFLNAILIAFTAPWMGRLIDRKGERGPLSFYALALILVFLGYASVQSVWALYVLFLLDHVLFTFGMGFTTYLHRIARPGELTPCLSMGVTMNHVAAVTVPWLGALLWEGTRNYQAPFWVGVAIAAVSLVATRWLPLASEQPSG